MPAVIEFGFDSKTVFSGMDELDRRLRKQDTSVASSQAKLAAALRNPWVSAGVDVQKYGAELLRAEKQARLLAVQQARMATMQVTGVNYKAASNPWGSAGASQYAAQQDAAKQAAAAAALMESQQRAAMAAATAQQRVAAANSATQQKAMAAAAAADALAAAEQRKAALQANNGRMNLALLEAQIAGNKREAAGIEARIGLMERMRTIQQLTNVSQREAYTLAQRSAGIAMVGGGGKGAAARMNIGMGAMQMQDVAVQMQMGTKMSTILAQQGSQLLSIFGPGGMILGGLVAVGGMFYSMQQAGVEALKALKAEADNFDASLNKLKSGGVMEMIDGMEKMKKRAEEMREASSKAPGAFERFFSPSSFDSKTNKWTNNADAKQQTQKQVATDNEQGRLQLMRDILKTSEEELRISEMRAAGRDAEVDKLQREKAMRRELDKADAADPAIKGQLKSNITAKYANEQKKADADEAKKKQEEMQRLADAQKGYDERKLQASLEEMDMAERIAAMNVEAQRAIAEENRLKSAANRDDLAILDAAGRSLEINRERNRLQRQYSDEKAREAKEAEQESKRRKEEAQQAAKEASQRRGTVMDTALEYKMLQAKAGHRTREIEQIEYQQRVMDRSRRLEEQNGMKKSEALAMAMKMTDLEDRANGKRTRIRGVQDNSDPNQRNGLSGAWRDGPSGNRSYRAMGMGSDPMSRNGGLNGFWDLQAGNIGGQRTASERYNTQPYDFGKQMQDNHMQNAAKENSTGSPMVDTFIEKIITRLPPALAAAILAET